MLMVGKLGNLLRQELCFISEGKNRRTKGLKGGVGFTQLSQGLTLDSQYLVEVVVELLGQQLCHEVKVLGLSKGFLRCGIPNGRITATVLRLAVTG